MKPNTIVLFFRNKLVEFANLLYDIINPIISKKGLNAIKYIFIGYWISFGIGFIYFYTIGTPTPNLSVFIEYPLIGYYVTFLIAASFAFIGIFVYCVIEVIKKILTLILDNIYIAKKGKKVQCKWKIVK